MNDLHSHSTFQVYYDEFTRIFINSFCDNRRKNISIGDSVARAKKEVKKSMFKILDTGEHSPKLVAMAWKKSCHDTKIVEKAVRYYHRIEKIK